jgi:hypothetical protein
VSIAKRSAIYGTGFSRESVRRHTEHLMAFAMASSRLKPVPLTSKAACTPPLKQHAAFSGTGFSRESVRRHTAKLMAHTAGFSRFSLEGCNNGIFRLGRFVSV